MSTATAFNLIMTDGRAVATRVHRVGANVQAVGITQR